LGDPAMRDSGGTASGFRRPGALHCAIVTTARIYVTQLTSDAILCVHACAILVCLSLRQEAATLPPGTDQIALIDLLQLILLLMLAAMVLTWPL
jgi:hypothetical protein